MIRVTRIILVPTLRITQEDSDDHLCGHVVVGNAFDGITVRVMSVFSFFFLSLSLSHFLSLSLT